MCSYINIHTHRVGEGINVLDVGAETEWANREKDRVLSEGQEVFYSVGIHPMNIGQGSNRLLGDMQKTVRCDQVIAIGECGLDRRSSASMEEQKTILEAQVQLAEEHRKPLIIHCVKAYPELIALRKRSGSTVPWMIHGFNNNEQILMQLLEYGFYISIGAALLNPQSNAFHLIRKIPLDSLFLENDDDEMGIEVIYGAASCMVGMEVKGLKKVLWENYIKVFG